MDVDPLTTISNRFLVAVSATARTGSWTGFAFPVDPVDGNFGDFPTFGLDGSGLEFLSADIFDGFGDALGATLVAIPKASLLTTPPSIAGRTEFGLFDYSVRGDILQPSVNIGGSTNGEVVIAVEAVGTDFQAHSSLRASVIQNAANPDGAVLSAPATLSIPPYRVPINPAQPGNNHNLDNGDARISAFVYRVGDTLFAVHGTEQNSRAAIQWFKVDAINLQVVESGVVTNSTLELFFPSIAANPSGTVVIGCNGSSSTNPISAYVLVGETVNGALTFGAPILSSKAWQLTRIETRAALAVGEITALPQSIPQTPIASGRSRCTQSDALSGPLRSPKSLPRGTGVRNLRLNRSARTWFFPGQAKTSRPSSSFRRACPRRTRGRQYLHPRLPPMECLPS